MFLPGTEAWMVHISEGVQRPVVGGQVLLEPPRLGGTRATANLLAVAVEGYHVPGPQLVGVVASLRVACGLTGVLEVASGTFGKVLVVAGDGLGAPLEPPPRRPVAFLEVHRRASGVSLIAQGQDRPVDTLDQLGGSLVASERQLAMSPAATTSAEGVGSESQPQAMRRTATVARITPVAVLLLAPTPLITAGYPWV